MQTPQKFRKKPVVIEAILWTGENVIEVANFLCAGLPLSDMKKNYRSNKNEDLIIKTLEGEHLASHGDWIIKGVAGEFYPCKPDIFEKTYELVK